MVYTADAFSLLFCISSIFRVAIQSEWEKTIQKIRTVFTFSSESFIFPNEVIQHSRMRNSNV